MLRASKLVRDSGGDQGVRSAVVAEMASIQGRGLAAEGRLLDRLTKRLGAKAVDIQAIQANISDQHGSPPEIQKRIGLVFQQLPNRPLNPEQYKLLLSRDLATGATALHHILLLGKQRADLAQELVAQVGVPMMCDRRAFGRCYARTANALFARFRPAEYVRILSALFLEREVRLASGQVVRWDPAQLAMHPSWTPAQQIDFVWGCLGSTLRHKAMPNPAALSNDRGIATRGEMANILSRLTGERYVNANVGFSRAAHAQHAPGSCQCMKLLGALDAVSKQTPVLLAEYNPPNYVQSHAGSVARVDLQQGMITSYETGGAEWALDHVGYVVVPERAAQAAGLPTMELPADDACGYLDPKTLALRARTA
jgi:hypothetical protein